MLWYVSFAFDKARLKTLQIPFPCFKQLAELLVSSLINQKEQSAC